MTSSSRRLSADSCALKGFNRVDRGSQNNLVDFSETEDHISSFHHDDVINAPVTSQTTNPFHNASTAISETSSTELNPFDKIHFIPQRLTSSASSTPIPMIPPPPGSLGRYRRKRITSQSSVNSSLPIVTSQTRSPAVLDDLPVTEDQIKSSPLPDILHPKDLEESLIHHSSLKSLEDPKDTKEDLCSLNPDDLIPTATSWNMEMRFPQQKRVMSSRRWVPIYVTISVESVSR